MWSTGSALMLTRLTGSTLFMHQNLTTIWTGDHRTYATQTTDIISKMRELRAKSPFASYLKDNYNEVKSKYPDLKLTDITKKISETWKALTENEKQVYLKQYQDKKNLYEQEKKRLSPSDLQLLEADNKARRIAHRVKKNLEQLPTKKPRSAFVHFFSSLDRGEADVKTFMKGAAQRWAQLPVQDKQKFEDLHQEEKKEYAKALLQWATSNESVKKPTKTAKRSPSKKKKDKDSSSSEDESPRSSKSKK